MKQTAVSWLIHNIVDDQIDRAKSMSEWLVIFDKAKAMEKEQIIDAYASGSNDRLKNVITDYYNETYATTSTTKNDL